jgi:hypothetical protein
LSVFLGAEAWRLCLSQEDEKESPKRWPILRRTEMQKARSRWILAFCISVRRKHMTEVMCLKNRKKLPVYTFEHHEKVSAIPLGQTFERF